MPFVLTSADLSVGSSATTCRPRQHTIRTKPPRYIVTIVLGMRAHPHDGRPCERRSASAADCRMLSRHPSTELRNSLFPGQPGTAAIIRVSTCQIPQTARPRANRSTPKVSGQEHPAAFRFSMAAQTCLVRRKPNVNRPHPPDAPPRCRHRGQTRPCQTRECW